MVRKDKPFTERAASLARDVKPASNSKPALRQRAESKLAGQAASSAQPLAALTSATMQQMLGELQVHQIELEMQNDELRRTQEALDAERSRYFDLYDLAPVGYCTLDEAGLVLEANLTAATLLGMTRSALIKRPLSRFILKADRDIYNLYRQQLLESGPTQSCELRMARRDGSYFWVHLATSVARNADGVVLQRVILSDISASKFLDQALQEKNLDLESARKAADKANRAKSDFLSSMSHELRSPLNAILGFAQLMESGSTPLSALQQGRIDHILQAGWYLLTLIDEILDLAKVESGKLQLSMEPVSLSEELHDCRVMIEPQAQESGIRMLFAQLDRPYFVLADRTRLKQVIVNLLSNAIKYNRVGGTVEVRCSFNTPGRVRISIKDSGPGLSPEQLAHLFQPFNRLGQEGGAKEGTGIGLVVSKRLVEMMGGSIGVQSSVGVGSVFWIELNLADVLQTTAGADSPPSPALPRACAEPGAARHALLYIEDNLANLTLVEQLIARRPDLRLLSAGDGARGIALARSEQPQVILMDINLPDLSGLQALKILRADAATQHIPVLALSANAMPHDIEEGLAAGFLRYLTKPVKLNVLMQALELALEVAQSSSVGAKKAGDLL